MTIPFMKKRIVHPQREDMQVLLLKNDIEMPPDITEMAKSTQEQLQALDTGSIALVYEELDGKTDLQKPGQALPTKFEVDCWHDLCGCLNVDNI